MTMTCTATQLIDNARTRVTRFDFEPGQQTGWHTHATDYVITTLTDCKMRIELPDGKSMQNHVPAGSAYKRTEGTEHNVINDGDAPMSFIEIALK